MNLSFQTFVNRPTTPTTPSLARRPTDPVTTPSPGFRSVVGTASADISFDLDYNNIRSGKRINSAGKEEFERLQVGKWIGKPLPLKLRNPLELISSSGRSSSRTTSRSKTRAAAVRREIWASIITTSTTRTVTRMGERRPSRTRRTRSWPNQPQRRRNVS